MQPIQGRCVAWRVYFFGLFEEVVTDHLRDLAAKVLQIHPRVIDHRVEQLFQVAAEDAGPQSRRKRRHGQMTSCP